MTSSGIRGFGSGGSFSEGVDLFIALTGDWRPLTQKGGGTWMEDLTFAAGGA